MKAYKPLMRLSIYKTNTTESSLQNLSTPVYYSDPKKYKTCDKPILKGKPTKREYETIDSSIKHVIISFMRIGKKEALKT